MKTMTISQRIIVGFSILLAITSLAGALTAWQMHQAAAGAHHLAIAVAPQTEESAGLHDTSNNIQLAVTAYALTGDPAQLELAEKNLRTLDQALTKCRALVQSQPALTTLAANLKTAAPALQAYRDSIAATRLNWQAMTKTRAELDTAAARLQGALTGLLTAQDKLLSQEIAQGLAAAALETRRQQLALTHAILDAGNAIRIANFKSQAWRDPQWIGQATSLFGTIKKHLADLQGLTTHQAHRQQLAEIDLATTAYQQATDAVIRHAEEAQRLGRERTAAAEAFDGLVSAVLEHSIKETTDFADTSAASLDRSSEIATGSLILALLVGGLVSYLLIHRLNRTLQTTAGGLTEGALQIAAASGQVAATSQTLAQGASEQAASLEEISSSLEELAHTTRHNADHAAQAKAAADAARAAAEAGAAEMDKMQEAMTGIHQSSAAISKIIKTIDEIAFQTNILALNAAVEAARAGEAGAGFAVVADEVRTLAQRCAVAARETTDKISDASTRSEQGARLTTSVSASLTAIVAKSREVDRLVAHVASASHDQSEGLQQVTTAIAQMDQVTQSNAAAAEESASAAEELNAQAAELKHASSDLSALVGLRTESPAGRPHAARARAHSAFSHVAAPLKPKARSSQPEPSPALSATNAAA